jgi:hypothetical protein
MRLQPGAERAAGYRFTVPAGGASRAGFAVDFWLTFLALFFGLLSPMGRNSSMAGIDRNLAYPSPLKIACLPAKFGSPPPTKGEPGENRPDG